MFQVSAICLTTVLAVILQCRIHETNSAPLHSRHIGWRHYGGHEHRVHYHNNPHHHRIFHLHTRYQPLRHYFLSHQTGIRSPVPSTWTVPALHSGYPTSVRIIHFPIPNNENQQQKSSSKTTASLDFPFHRTSCSHSHPTVPEDNINTSDSTPNVSVEFRPTSAPNLISPVKNVQPATNQHPWVVTNLSFDVDSPKPEILNKTTIPNIKGSKFSKNNTMDEADEILTNKIPESTIEISHKNGNDANQPSQVDKPKPNPPKVSPSTPETSNNVPNKNSNDPSILVVDEAGPVWAPESSDPSAIEIIPSLPNLSSANDNLNKNSIGSRNFEKFPKGQMPYPTVSTPLLEDESSNIIPIEKEKDSSVLVVDESFSFAGPVWAPESSDPSAIEMVPATSQIKATALFNEFQKKNDDTSLLAVDEAGPVWAPESSDPSAIEMIPIPSSS